MNLMDDLKSTFTEKPVVGAIIVVVGIVVGYFLRPVINKVIGKGKGW